MKRTDGRGKPATSQRGRKLWPKALHVRMRFHDLRHTFATELLRQGVDVHRVQRLMRHSDVRVTTAIYGHLDVEDLRAAVDGQVLLQAPPPLALPPAIAATAGSAPQSPKRTHGRSTGLELSRGRRGNQAGMIGAPCWDRTSDPHRVKVVLYR